MADRNFDELQILGKFKKVIAGSFAPNGSSAVDNTSNTGRGFSVARTGVGAFTITLEDKYAALDQIGFQLALGTPASAHDICVGAVDVSSAKTIAFVHYSGGAAADIAAATGNRIYFELVLANSTAIG